jgi:hypothetical protein
MNKETSKEKQFSEDVDRLIAGEHVAGEDTSLDDYEKNVQFTKKMLDSRIEPSPDFKESLRRRLLLKMVEGEVKAERKRANARNFWDFVANLIPKSPIWRSVTATVAVAVLVLVVVWQLGVFTQPNQTPLVGSPPPPSSIVNQGPVDVTVVTSQTTYKTGENISIVLKFNNTSNEDLTLSPFPPQILIAATSLRPYRNIPGGESIVLPAGESIEYTITWDQTDNEGVQVPAGEYIINMLDIELVGSGGVVTLVDSPHVAIIP